MKIYVNITVSKLNEIFNIFYSVMQFTYALLIRRIRVIASMQI